MSENRTGKHIPQRTCVACREVNEKKALIRVVKSPDGVSIDLTGRKSGRGAYVHDTRECWEKALKRGTLSRALKTELSEAELTALQEHAESLNG